MVGHWLPASASRLRWRPACSMMFERNARAAVKFLPPDQAREAQGVATDALEYIGMVVEFDGWDDLSYDYVGRFAAQDTPEKVAFVRKSLLVAQRDLDKLLNFFTDADLKLAREYFVMYYGGQ